MVEIILKNNINKSKIKALLEFLKLMNIDAELKGNARPIKKKKNAFSLSVGIWNDYKISAIELRTQAWVGEK